jgi:hypothetical protein
MTHTSKLDSLWYVSCVITIFLAFILIYSYKIARFPNDVSTSGIIASTITVLIFSLFSVFIFQIPGFLIILPLYLVLNYYHFETSKAGFKKTNSISAMATIMGVFAVVTGIYSVGLLQLKSEVLIGFYSVCIGIYTLILTIIGTVSVSKLDDLKDINQRIHSFHFFEALKGLIRMCIIFILITLIAFLTGMFTTNQNNPPNLLALPFVFSNLWQLYPIIILGLVAISIPAVLFHMYSIITFYLSEQSN